jgi:Protein of unknown function (DUF1071)
MQSTWKILSAINVNEHVEKKPNGCTYLSWAWAWGVTKEMCPSAAYKVINFDGRPYLFDENLGYMVQTEVTINGETLPMHLFVMDGANKAQKHIDYKYTVRSGEKTCLAASMFDINTAIMRCLTKNLAMFGLGHYIYAGEDLPHESEESKQDAIKAEFDRYENLIKTATNEADLTRIWRSMSKELQLKLQQTATKRKAILTKQPEAA